MTLGMLAAALLCACGASGSHVRSTASTAAPPAARAPVRAARTVGAAKPPPGTAALDSALDRLFAKAGPTSGGAVYDLSDGRPLFGLRAGLNLPPASVEKLYTSVAALQKLGPDATFKTTVMGAGQLGAGGLWHGDLYLVGGGDPTLGDSTFNRIWENGYGPTASELVAQLRRVGIRRVSGHVIADGSLFDSRPGPPSSGFAPDVPDIGGQLAALTFDHGSTAANLTAPTFATRQLARTMRAQGIAATATREAGAPPSGTRQLAAVNSPRLAVLLRLMDVPSDDFFGEMLTKQLGVRFGSGGTTAGGAQVIASAVSVFGIHPAIVDGSGLSRSDRSSPAEVVKLLRELRGTTVGADLDAALPTLGVNGTVRTIAANTRAKGRCIAKTGTLDNVTNLAGYCHALGGKLLAFALFVDGPSNWSALMLETQMVAAIARL